MAVAMLTYYAMALASCTTNHTPPKVRSPYRTTLLFADGKDIAEERCLACHSAMLITQQHKDSTAWTKTVSQMEAWSAPIQPGERDSLVRYLVSSYGPRPAAR
jgi:hypothetical protein